MLYSSLLAALGLLFATHSWYLPSGAGGTPSSPDAGASAIAQPYDWAADDGSEYATDMLGGDVTLTGWTQASSWGAANAFDSVAIDTAQNSQVVKAAITGNGVSAGWITDSVSGNFCYTMRIGYNRGPIIATTNTYMEAYGAFADSPSLGGATWGGVGYYLTGSGALFTGNQVYTGTGTGWAANSSTLPVGAKDAFAFDIGLKRVGTTLSVFYGLPLSPLTLVQTYTVGTGAGKLGMRAGTQTDATVTMYLYAFRRYSTCPF